jgi:hypothetical protein
MKVAETKSTTTKAAAAKAADKPTDQPATPTMDTGADNPMTSTDGEKMPEDFGANKETFESATWAQTHGTNPIEETKLSDY